MHIWVRLGFGALLTSFFYFLAAKLAPSLSMLTAYRGLVAACLAGPGLLLAVVGLVVYQSRTRSRRTGRQGLASAPEEADDEVPIFGLTFWGPLLVAFGGVLFFLPTPDLKPPPVSVHARPAPVTAPEPAPAPERDLDLPPLKLQGITYSSGRPSVIINSHTYFEGEALGQVKVLSIEPDQVTVLYGGRTNTLRLERLASHLKNCPWAGR